MKDFFESSTNAGKPLTYKDAVLELDIALAANKRLREAFKDAEKDIEKCLVVLRVCIDERQSAFDYKLFSTLNKCKKLAQEALKDDQDN